MSPIQSSLASRAFLLSTPTRIKKRSKLELQNDSGPQGLTRVSVMQPDPFVSSRA